MSPWAFPTPLHFFYLLLRLQGLICKLSPTLSVRLSRMYDRRGDEVPPLDRAAEARFFSSVSLCQCDGGRVTCGHTSALRGLGSGSLSLPSLGSLFLVETGRRASCALFFIPSLFRNRIFLSLKTAAAHGYVFTGQQEPTRIGVCFSP